MKLLEPADLGSPFPELGERPATGLRPWLVAWLGLPVLGIANGALRDATYKRATGELAAHQLSTVTLLGLMAAYLWVLERRWPIRTSREAFTIGGSWAVLTILFEFGFGHYVIGDAWSSLLHAYNVADGQVWAAVPLWTVVVRRSSGGSLMACTGSGQLQGDGSELLQRRSMASTRPPAGRPLRREEQQRATASGPTPPTAVRSPRWAGR